MKAKPIKLPVSDLFVGTSSEIIANRFTGESVELVPEAVAVYDYIMGCEILGDYKGMRKGLDWFIKYFPEAYMILLD